MIHLRTVLKVADNSGAKIVSCFNILGGSHRKYGQIGDVIVCSVKQALPHSNVKNKSIVRGVIVRQKKNFKRNDGTYIKFDENAVVIIEAGNQPKGTRIFGPVIRELKERGFPKIVSLADEVL